MASNSSSSPETRPARRDFVLALLVLLVTLGALFHQSFEADQVLFANDGPLGALVAYADVATSFFTGSWHTLNWIGIKQPSALPNLTYSTYLLWGPLIHAKFFTPLALLLLGLGVWTLFRQLRFNSTICILGALAAVLNTDPFSYACWGLPSLPLTVATVFFALAALASPSSKRRWLKIALAGLALGMGIMEGYDNGAIFSLYIAAFVVFQCWLEEGAVAVKAGKSFMRVAIVAVFAAFMAAHALSTLIGTQIKGVAGMQQEDKSKEVRWTEATMWSLPKIETLRVIIPGLFGYRMDTQDGGYYWGSVGQTPGNPKTRHSGSGVYGGVFVVLVALWALLRAARAQGSPFSTDETRWIWFWAGVAFVSLLLAFGRFAPFYQFFYMLPYFSTIRNPIKFMHPFNVALVVLFGYGLQGLYRQYLERNRLKFASPSAQLKDWWTTVPSFDRRWTIGSIVLICASVLGWLLYTSSRLELRRHLEHGGFPLEVAASVARFSYTEVGWFILFLTLSSGLMILILSGALSGTRIKWAGLAMGLLVLTDFSRANSPWIIYYNYRQKYAANPFIDFLREKPYEHRVAARLIPHMPVAYLSNDEAWPQLYQVMLEHHFQYYHIQSLDIIQMPRMQEMDANYLRAFSPKIAANLTEVGRLWQLTNTRFVLGMRPFLDLLNDNIDPAHKSFRVHSVLGTGDSQVALFEFGAALPRAKLYPQWQCITNNNVITNSDQAILQRLVDPTFDPAQTVLIADSLPPAPAASANFSTNQNAGTVSFTHYEPKRVSLKSDASTPTVLLLNDRYDSDWHVRVDGESKPLLRCNYIMRGVYLPPGQHAIEFIYDAPASTLYISLAAIGVGFAICGFLFFGNGASKQEATADSKSGDDSPNSIIDVETEVIKTDSKNRKDSTNRKS